MNWTDLADKCKGCGAPIVFMKTRKGKYIPVDAESIKTNEVFFNPNSGMIAHFATCPKAQDFRKPKQKSWPTCS